LSISLSYYKRNLRIALPCILAMVGQAVVQVTDAIMLGRLGTLELGAASFGSVLFFNVLVFGMGVMMGLTPLIGQAFAQKDEGMMRKLMGSSLTLSILLGAFLTLVLLGLYSLLGRMGQPEEILPYLRPYFLITLFSLAPFLWFLVYKQGLEGLGNTRVAMWITLVSVVLNIVFNALLIYGLLGFPSLGIKGAAWASVIARGVMPLLMLSYLSRASVRKKYAFLLARVATSRTMIRKLLSVGLPIAGQLAIECFALSAITLMMGWINVVSLAANQIAQSIITLTFMVSNGVSSAVTVLVSQACGRGEMQEMRSHLHCGLRLSGLFMLVAALVLGFFGEAVASLYTTDPEVVRLAGQLFVIVGLFELFDGLQVTALGGLRGITDVKIPFIIAAASYILVCIPFAYLCGFVLHFGALGVLSGFMVGLIVAAVCYLWRFHYSLSKMQNLTS
jgi:putative efflux protein, MATE family